MAAIEVEGDIKGFEISEIQEFFEDMQCKKLLDNVFKTLEKDPLFHASEKELTGQLPLSDLGHLTHMRMKKFLDYRFATMEMFMENPVLGAYVPTNLGMLGYGWGLIARHALNVSVGIFWINPCYIQVPI